MISKIQKFKILSWNCRGLGRLDKCDVVRNVIRQSRCDICMLQETKMNENNLNYVSVLPFFFERNCVVVHAHNTSGGLLISWKYTYKLISSWGTRHTCSALLQQINSGAFLLVTNVYGPSTDDLKPAFIEEIRRVASLVHHSWILGGDFNLV